MKPPADVSAAIWVATARLPDGRIDDMKLWSGPRSLIGRIGSPCETVERDDRSAQFVDRLRAGGFGDEIGRQRFCDRPILPAQLAVKRGAGVQALAGDEHLVQFDCRRVSVPAVSSRAAKPCSWPCNRPRLQQEPLRPG
jgi:hypothetical protein